MKALSMISEYLEIQSKIDHILDLFAENRPGESIGEILRHHREDRGNLGDNIDPFDRWHNAYPIIRSAIYFRYLERIGHPQFQGQGRIQSLIDNQHLFDESGESMRDRLQDLKLNHADKFSA